MPTAAGADAVFTITAGPRVRVGSARVEGPPAVMAILEPDIRPHVGEPFRREQAQAAARRMRADLVRLGYWRAVVTVAEAYDPRRGDHGARLPGRPRVRSWTSRCAGSARPASKGRIRDLLKEGELKSDAVEEASDLLEEDARRQGYRLAHVSHHEEQRGPRLVLVYDVEAGPRATVASVHVEGEGAEGLETTLKTRPGEPLVDATVAEDARALTRALEERGHPAARVEADVPGRRRRPARRLSRPRRPGHARRRPCAWRARSPCRRRARPRSSGCARAGPTA